MTTSPQPPAGGGRDPWSVLPWVAGVVAVVAVALLGVAVYGRLTDGGADAAEPPSAPRSSVNTGSTPGAATTSAPPSPRDQAVAEAEAAYRRYLAVDDAIAMRGGGRHLENEYVKVARYEAFGDALANAQNLAAGHLHYTGRRSIVKIEPTTVKIEGARAAVTLEVCVDGRSANLVDEEGRTRLPPNLGRFYVGPVDVERLQDGWKVNRDKADLRRSC